MNPEWIAFADKQREAAILREETSLPLDHSHLAQLPQRVGATHDDVGIEAGLATDVERQVAKRDSASPDHLDDDRLGYGHHYYVVQIEIGILHLRLGPRRECADHVFAEQRHEVIAFGKDHQTRRRSDPADDVRYSVGVTGKRSNAWL